MRKGPRFSLFTRFAWLAGFLALSTVVTTQLYFQRHERTMLELRLSEKANFINNFYAFLIADALQHNDDVTLLQVVNRLEEDQEITSVIVVDQNLEIRYHVDPEKVGTVLDDPLLKRTLETGEGVAQKFENAGGPALALASSLRIKGQSQPKGAIRIDFTYRHIANQVKAGQSSFQMMALGGMMFMVGGILMGLRRWIVRPVTRLKNGVAAVNPAILDANLPEGEDEFGQINAMLNQFITKLRAEWAGQREALTVQAGDERILVEQLARGLMPDVRTLIIDRQNRVLCDTGRDVPFGSQDAPHLLDLVSDDVFSELIVTAFKKEGEVQRGDVTFDGQAYQAAVLRIPEGQSKLVRTVIALRQSAQSQSTKEAV